MPRLTKQQMTDALLAAGTNPAQTATITQLRSMYTLLEIDDASDAQYIPNVQPNLNVGGRCPRS